MATIILRSAGVQLKNNVIDANFININNEVITATAAIIVNAADIDTNTAAIAANIINIANKIDKTTSTLQSIVSDINFAGALRPDITSSILLGDVGKRWVRLYVDDITTTNIVLAGTLAV